MGNWNQWSDETTEQLKALWKTGLSASRIACRIPNSTRNSILGKVHRLNLESRRPSHIVAQTREERNARAREDRSIRRHVAKSLMNGHSPSLAPINGKTRHMRPRLWKTRHAPPVARPNGTPVSILEVTGCKFAVKSEGREHLFCNSPCEGPWCEYHSAIVWGPL